MYKRQLFEGGKAHIEYTDPENVLESGIELVAQPPGKNPVSYTHLDVYKRQAMAGVDGIIFTAGLGENSSKDRAAVCSGLKYLGIQLDEEKNSKRGEALVISTPDSRTKVMVIPTNEELMIARDTVELVG